MAHNRALKFLVILIFGCVFSHSIFADSRSSEPDSVTDFLTGTIIYSSDLEKSIDFYTDVMGLKIVHRMEKEGQLTEVLLSTSGKFLDGMMLTLQPGKNRPQQVNLSPDNFGVILFMSTSNERVAERLRSAEYPVTFEDSQHLFSKDPDGYRLMVYEISTEMLNAVK